MSAEAVGAHLGPDFGELLQLLGMSDDGQVTLADWVVFIDSIASIAGRRSLR